MTLTYLRIAIRNLLRQKAYTLINVLGLAIGLACCLLIFLYVQDEMSYDSHYKNADRIYRIATHINFGGKESHLALAPAPMGPTLPTIFPEVEQAVRFRGQGSFLIARPGEQIVKENRVIFADSTFFQVFRVPLLSGDANEALVRPATIVLSRSTATRYFGSDNPLGERLVLDNTREYEVTGVFDDMPSASHFHFDFIASLSSLEESNNTMWGSNNFRTYLLLRPGATKEAVEARFPGMILTYLGPQIRELMGSSLEELFAQGSSLRYELQPLRDIHLTSDLAVEFEPNGNLTTVYIFLTISISILFIACMNFVNLSTARSARRSREVGIRKVVGSGRSQLVTQFLAESVLLSLFALLAAIGLVELLLPTFNALAEKHLSSSLLVTLPVAASLLLGSILVGLLAGAYPAFILSSFKPIVVLRGRSVGFSSGRLRSTLVVLQYAASVVLIAGTLVVQSQVRYTSQKKLGYQKDQVIIVEDTYTLRDQVQAFKQQALADPMILSGTSSSYLPVFSNRSDTQFWPEGTSPGEHPVSMQIWTVDEDYIPTMGMTIVEGRNFSKELGTDDQGVIINRRAAASYGFDNPLGKRINYFPWSPRGVDPNNIQTYTIVGVVDNFHYDTMKNPIGALGLRLGTSRGRVSFRFNGENVAGVISSLERTWNQFAPQQAFSYSFLDEEFAKMYTSERRVGDVLNAFAVLAIFVACLGLYGLAAFAAEQRTKEVGIRKVLGATSTGIVIRFGAEFARLIGIAFLLAIPVIYLGSQRWLEDFAYRVDLDLWVFIFAGGAALALAMITVSVQALRAALADPVDSLRHE